MVKPACDLILSLFLCVSESLWQIRNPRLKEERCKQYGKTCATVCERC
jgi:hypothetical protein